MGKFTSEQKLLNLIMEGYWWKCISKKNDRFADRDINDLLEKFIKSCKTTYDPFDLNRSVLNLTNSQKRKLYKTMLNSGILER